MNTPQPHKYKVLVTGSSGFIGSNLTAYLREQGYDVLGLDHREPEGAAASVPFVKCDLLEADRFSSALSDYAPDYVIHLAARADLDGKTVEDYAANSDGVANLMRAVKTAGSVKRGIYTSTQLVCEAGYIPKTDTDYKPSTPYGESKILTEKNVRAADGGGVEWCLTRPTTVWGPGMSPHYQNLFRMIRKGRYFHVGKKPLEKSYSYVGNFVYQYLKLLQAPVEQIQGKVFYMADYVPITLQAWTDEFQRLLGAPPIKTLPLPVARIGAAVGDVLKTVGVQKFPFTSFRLRNVLTEYLYDLSPTEAVCGPLPYDMRQGAALTMKWYMTKEGIAPRG